MQTFYDLFHWWYKLHDNSDSGVTNGLYYTAYQMFYLSIVAYICLCIGGVLKLGGDRWAAPFVIVVCAVLITLLIGFGGPILVIFLTIIGIGYILEKIGDSFRNNSKSKESNRVKALAELINSDPDFKLKYEELIKNTPKI